MRQYRIIRGFNSFQGFESKTFDLMSIGIILLVLIFSCIRFYELPQWIDDYYHLSVANAFIKSGGWVGWNWWDFAPVGRPHLYPPFYHLILVFLLKIGLGGLNSVRIIEVLILPLFFFSIWYILKKILNPRFSFFTLLALSSFPPFYSSVSANVPASMAVIFGLLTWLFVKKRRFVSATLSFAVTFYTHVGIPWIFLSSLLFLALFNREYRRVSLRVILTGLLFALPILYHQFKFMDYVTLQILQECRLTSFSIFITVLGAASLFFRFHLKKGGEFFIPLFWGYLLGSLAVFVKYPYRFFCAQGLIGLALFSSLFLEKTISLIGGKKAALFIIVLIAYLFFFHATFNLEWGKPEFRLFDSTYYNFLTGKFYRFPSFRGLILSGFFPIEEVIRENTSPSDIVSSNVSIVSQVFSALTRRPSANSMFWEVRPKDKYSYYKYAKLIIWVKLAKGDIDEPKGKQWKQIYEDDFAYVYLNPSYRPSAKIIKSKIRFNHIFIILLIISLLTILSRWSALSKNRPPLP